MAPAHEMLDDIPPENIVAMAVRASDDEPRRPLFQLPLVVKVLGPLLNGHPGLFPRLAAAPVGPDVHEVWAGHLHDRGHARLMSVVSLIYDQGPANSGLPSPVETDADLSSPGARRATANTGR